MNIAGMSSDAFLQQGNLESIKSKGNTPEGLKEAAESFESVFLNMLLKSMREANEAFGDENLLGGSQEKFYRTMLDGQMAQELGSGGGIGLAEAMIKQLQNPITIGQSVDKF